MRTGEDADRGREEAGRELRKLTQSLRGCCSKRLATVSACRTAAQLKQLKTDRSDSGIRVFDSMAHT